jgi:hypothetical protein
MVETHSLTILRTQSHATTMWCISCGANSQMVPVQIAAILAAATERTIFGLIETERLHFNETPQGQLLICTESLRRLD